MMTVTEVNRPFQLWGWLVVFVLGKTPSLSWRRKIQKSIGFYQQVVVRSRDKRAAGYVCVPVCLGPAVNLGVKAHPSSATSSLYLQPVYQQVKPHYQTATWSSHSRLLNHNELLTVANLSSKINHHSSTQAHTRRHRTISPLDLLWRPTSLY